MRRDTLFRDAVHFLRAYLHFERLTAVNHSRMQGLVQVRPRHGNVILEAAGHGAPDVMDDAESGVTVAFCICDDADSEKIVNLLDASPLTDNFPMERVQTLAASFEFSGNAVFDELGADSGLNVLEEAVVYFRFVRNFLLQGEISFQLKTTERKIF